MPFTVHQSAQTKAQALRPGSLAQPHGPHHTSPHYGLRSLWLWGACLCLTLAWDASGADLRVMAWLGSPQGFALRDHWLADFLSGERAATVSPSFDALYAHDTGRGWLLTGRLPDVPNRPWEGFSLVAPLRLGDAPAGWALLRSEEDGLSAQADADHPAPHLATLALRRVYFREDEWLGEADLAVRMAPVASALAPFKPRTQAITA